MFSLIITIISIALVTALALATIYYGGSAFRQGGDAAAAARLINEGQQLSGAAAVATATNVTFATVADLQTANLLSSAPASWTVAEGAFEQLTVPTAVCDKVNAQAGLSPRPADVTGITNYGCYGAAAAAGTMVFKY